MNMQSKGFAKAARHLARVHLKYAKRPRRYRQLLREIRSCRPRSIVEIGVFEGVRAVEMIEAASIDRPPQEIEYFGFDLFEQMTPEIFEKELSKWPLTEEKVRERLLETGASISLRKGPTSETLPDFVCERRGRPVDFVFIDGGHAIETIQSDWDSIRQIIGAGSTVLFDDYYIDCPSRIREFGCNAVLEKIDDQVYACEVLPDIDRFTPDDGPLNVAVAKLQQRK
jgi:hypothetical protein